MQKKGENVREVSMSVRVLDEDEPFRLVTDGLGHYAVLEARWGHVYPVHRHDCCGCDDTPEGMEKAAEKEWRMAAQALAEFDFARQGEQRLAEILW